MIFSYLQQTNLNPKRTSKRKAALPVKTKTHLLHPSANQESIFRSRRYQKKEVQFITISAVRIECSCCDFLFKR